jgi:cell wall assembly regulator SMI1
MSNSLLNALLDDLCRERRLNRVALLQRLEHAIERANPTGQKVPLSFNEERGAFEARGEGVALGGWADLAVQQQLVEIASEPVPERIKTVAPGVTERAEDSSRMAWAVVIAGRYAPAAKGLTLSGYRRLADRVRSVSAVTGLPLLAVPGRSLESWGRASEADAKAPVAVGWFVAAAENQIMPVGPYRWSDWCRTLRELDGMQPDVWTELREFLAGFTTENQLLLVVTGKYASGHMLAGTLEPCPLTALDARWPELFLSEDFHADFQSSGLLPRFGVRGRRLASASVSQSDGVLPLSADESESIFLTARSFEDEVKLAAPRRGDPSVEYGSLNRVPPAPVASDPHSRTRSMAEERPNVGLIGQILSALKPRASLLAELTRAEHVLREYFPDTLAEIGLRAGAPPEKRGQLAKALGFAQLPADVDVLLAWHDGQDGHASVFPERYDYGRWKLASIEDDLRQIELGKELANWRKSFLPLFEDGWGNHLVIDLENGHLVEWDHEEPENLRDVAVSLDRLLREGLAPWVEVFENAVWSALVFDFDSATLTPVASEVLMWSELTRLEVGALLISESSRGTSGLLNAGRDGEGSLFWVSAFAENRALLWDSFRTELRKPLPMPREVSAYEDSLLSTNLVSSAVGSKLWFGYVASARLP